MWIVRVLASCEEVVSTINERIDLDLPSRLRSAPPLSLAVSWVTSPWLVSEHSSYHCGLGVCVVVEPESSWHRHATWITRATKLWQSEWELCRS